MKVAAIQLGGTLAPVAERIAHDVGVLAQKFNELSPAERNTLVKLGQEFQRG